MKSTDPTKRSLLPLGFVAALLAIQVIIAAVMLFGPRPSAYGWQMYSAVPYIPEAWAVMGDAAEPIDVAALVVHDRAEIDFVALLRSHGCDLTGSDEIRIELADGTVEEVACR